MGICCRLLMQDFCTKSAASYSVTVIPGLHSEPTVIQNSKPSVKETSVIILWLFFLLIVRFVVCFLRAQRIKSKQSSCSSCPYNGYLKIFQSFSNYLHTSCCLGWLLSETSNSEYLLKRHLLLHVEDFP